MAWRIPLSDIDLGLEEEAAVQRVLRGRWLTMGETTKEFEDQFAKYMNSNYAIAVANGTAALHLACLAIGLEPGDEVIVPSLTFVATAAAVRYTNAEPVFADICGEHDLNVSPASIERLITPRTRAIIVMHYGGYPCDMPKIMALARKHGLSVIEDAAHAPGSELEDKKLGTWGEVGCFSLFSNKNLTTGEGGMLVTDDEKLASKMSRLRSHGMTTLTWDRHRGHAWSYDVVDLGFNYRLDEIRAAIGLVQLNKLPRNNDRRRSLSILYRELFREFIPEVIIPFNKHHGISACHIFPILLPKGTNRTLFMEWMKTQGIQTSVHYPPIHQFQYYTLDSESTIILPQTEDIAAREVTLPLYPNLSPPAIEMIVHAVRESLTRIQNSYQVMKIRK